MKVENSHVPVFYGNHICSIGRSCRDFTVITGVLNFQEPMDISLTLWKKVCVVCVCVFAAVLIDVDCQDAVISSSVIMVLQNVSQQQRE